MNNIFIIFLLENYRVD